MHGSGCIQIQSRNTAVKREWIEACPQEIKENNDNVLSITPEQQCGQIISKRKEGSRGLISAERCVREEENSLGFHVANSDNAANSENLIRVVAAAETRDDMTM